MLGNRAFEESEGRNFLAKIARCDAHRFEGLYTCMKFDVIETFTCCERMVHLVSAD